MIDMKQIQYMAACAQTGSFSRAAERLYTTQPSVSRVIKAMEEELGVVLFERHNKGISLTREGEHVYKYASQILESLQKLEPPKQSIQAPVLHICANPSSWFADSFLEFYRKHQKENFHYHISSLGTLEIVQRIQERCDDLGFVYVMKDQLPAFEYFLTRNYLEFTPLCSADIRLHPGALYSGRPKPDQEIDLSGLRLVQRFPDEFSADNYWNIRDENGYWAADAETVVVTNSDYIMERLLATSDLVNISSAYLTPRGSRKQDGIRLSGDNSQILFGGVKRRNEELPDIAAAFWDFIKERLAARD